jgi:hypothetical protein
MAAEPPVKNNIQRCAAIAHHPPRMGTQEGPRDFTECRVSDCMEIGSVHRSRGDALPDPGRWCHLCVDAMPHVFMNRMSDVQRAVQNSLDEALRATERRMLEDCVTATTPPLGACTHEHASDASFRERSANLLLVLSLRAATRCTRRGVVVAVSPRRSLHAPSSSASYARCRGRWSRWIRSAARRGRLGRSRCS